MGEMPIPATVILCEMQQAEIIDHTPFDVTPSVHDRLLNVYPDQVRQLLEWALNHRNQFGNPLWRAYTVDDYIVRALGTVGTASTADMLRNYVDDPELGHAAVAAVKAIETRTLEHRG